ncbi:MAG: alpha-amylase [Lachnospiraceae bacterium]
MRRAKNETGNHIDVRTREGEDMPLGISRQNEYVRFTAAMPKETSCTLLLYETGAETPVEELAMPQVAKGIFSLDVKLADKGKQTENGYEYLYRAGDSLLCDKYAVQIAGRNSFGREPEYVRSCVCLPEKCKNQYVRHPLEELILYKLHVRGFTMSPTSGVKHPGTYDGLAEKIPYLKELGINAVLLLPVTEFDELAGEHHRRSGMVFGMPERTYAGQKKESGILKEEPNRKVNYWGYRTGNTFYFAPKASYAANPAQACQEFAAMVDAFHEAGIDVYLEMMFDAECTQAQMLDVLRYWVRTYGVDGFHINDAELPLSLVAGDAYLQDTVFFATTVTEQLKNAYPGRLLEYRDNFSVEMRRYLKGDEGLVPALYHHFKYCRIGAGCVHYITDHNGFTLRDLYSYDVRHNEANGENGRDGAEYNFSWNCGEEGVTKKQKVEALRLKMMKNALMVLLLSRGIPMLLAGDEVARTKSGNNNSYCQDNEISWMDWGLCRKNKELLEYTKMLIALRKEHPMFWQERELRETDFLACGYPEISLHGVAPWQVDSSGYNRLAGILFCGNYVRKPDKTFEPHFYLLFNMHWEPHTFELPMQGDVQWQVLFATEGKRTLRGNKKEDLKKEAEETGTEAENKTIMELAPRSIVVLQGDKRMQPKQRKAVKRTTKRAERKLPEQETT